MSEVKCIKSPDALSSQQGVVLLVSLIMLLVISILVLSSVEQTTLQTRMAANQWDRAIAFEVAERTLVLAEKALEASSWATADFSSSGSNGLWLPENTNATQNWEKTGVWSNNQSVAIPVGDLDLTIGDTLVTVNIKASPRYMIELLKSVTGGKIYRVTVRAVGAGFSVVMLQSTYVK